MDNNSRVDSFLSPANRIEEKHGIIQGAVVTARLEQKAAHCAMHEGRPVDWDKMGRANEVMRHALRHQPGERGSMTVKPNTLLTND